MKIIKKLKWVLLVILVAIFLVGGFNALAEENLPNPGILPDSSFYFLKSWKESIQTFFTFGAENKAKQFLHLAEVRLVEYQKMIEKGKTEIAKKTLEKYEKQLSNALRKTEEAKEKGKDAEKIKEEIGEKILKHQEVLGSVLEKVPEEAKPGIEKVIEVVSGEKKGELEKGAEEIKVKIEKKVEKEETPSEREEKAPVQKIQKEHYLVITKKDSDFYPLAEYLSEKKNAKLISYQSKFDEVLSGLRNYQPEYLAIVLSPVELTLDMVDEIDKKLRNIDSDQFFDVAYGIITAFNVKEGYKYVDKLLQYSPKSKIKIYSPGMHGFYMNLKDDYGLDVTGHCIYCPSCWCDEEHKITAQRAVGGIKDSDVIAIVLHGSPSTMHMEGSEKLKGSKDGLYALDENGNKLPVTTNAALVTAMACTVGRINGKPSIIETGLNDSDVEGIIEDSIVLSFLKSGALNFVAPTHIATGAIDPQEEIIPQVILDRGTIGDAVKTLKNNYIMNITLNNKSFSGSPKVTDPFVNKFIEFHLRNWILFGDPEFRLRANKIEHPVCVQNFEESLITENNKLIKKIKTKILTHDKVPGGNIKDIAFSTITGIEKLRDGGLGSLGRTGGSGCMVHVPIESKDRDVKIEVKNLKENIIQKENLGDEIIFFVPSWALEKGGVPDFGDTTTEATESVQLR